MPKKRPPRNAFYYFMLDYKERCERNGERFPNGLKDVQEEAGPEWDQMSSAQKKPYEDKAKAGKQNSKGLQTSLHTSFANLDRQKREEEGAKSRMDEYIEKTIMSLSTRKLLAEHKFYLIHVNYFCVSTLDCYHPAELAISEFCLGDGVTNVYHTIIDPGQLPLGFLYEAIQKSESTHKIPVEENGGERDFSKIFRNIKKFLEVGKNVNGGEYPPMFTMPDNINVNTSISAVKNVMNTLCSSVPDNSPEYEDSENFPIYSLEKLFFELHKACNHIMDDGNAFTSMSLAQIELEKDMFNYAPSIACSFHFNEDSVEYCSKSYVLRWVYLISNYCCQYLKIKLISGRHMPEEVDLSHQQTRQLEEETKAQVQKPVNWIDHADNKQAQTSSWVPVQEPPLPRPRIQANLAAMLPEPVYHEHLDVSEENFPSMPVGGRGRLVPRGAGRGNTPMTFADAMRNRK